MRCEVCGVCGLRGVWCVAYGCVCTQLVPKKVLCSLPGRNFAMSSPAGRPSNVPAFRDLRDWMQVAPQSPASDGTTLQMGPPSPMSSTTTMGAETPLSLMFPFYTQPLPSSGSETPVSALVGSSPPALPAQSLNIVPWVPKPPPRRPATLPQDGTFARRGSFINEDLGTVVCVRCTRAVDACRVYGKSKGSWRCKVCNTRSAQLSKAFGSWPIQGFQKLSAEEQVAFWKQAAEANTTDNLKEFPCVCGAARNHGIDSAFVFAPDELCHLGLVYGLKGYGRHLGSGV